jgi:hypothetical protein
MASAGKLKAAAFYGSELIVGDAQVETVDIGSTLKVANLTTTQRDALTASNGMVVYNSSTNKFQGYENGSWTDLI